MYKITTVVRFRDRSDPQGTGQRWAAQQRSIAPSIPGLQRCIQSHVIGPLPQEADVQGVYSEDAQRSFDGYVSYWFADAAACAQAMATPEWSAFTDDHGELLDADFEQGLPAAFRECTIIEGDDPGPYKVVWIVRFKPELAKDEAHHYWEHVHGPIVREAGIDRYVQSHLIEGAPVGNGHHEPDYDGFSECWFPDAQGFIDALATPHWRRLHEDRHQIFAMSEMWCAALTELTIL